MTIAQETRHYSPEEYLEFEVDSELRHEYIDGLIIPMTGGTPNHNKIAGNLYVAIHFTLKRQPYEVYYTDQRLWIPKQRIHTYPDVMVIQTPPVFAEGRNDTITNPVMIAEVLSKSTKGYDRDEKFAAYRTIPSFQEYILIDQYTIHVEQYVKTDHRKWMFLDYEDINDTLNLTSIPGQISLADIYEKIDFSSTES